MSEQETSESTETVAEAIERVESVTRADPDPTTANTWRVLKRVVDDKDGRTLWVEEGTLPSDRYYLPPDDADIGALGGAGEYMLIRCESAYDVQTVRLVESTRYERAEEES